MKTSTKVLLGIGTAAVVGTAVAVAVSDKLTESIHHCKNRREVKKFVHHRFNGNKKILNIVDKLSDNEIEAVVKMIDKVHAGKNKISVAGQTANQTAEEVKEMLSNFIGNKLAKD